MFQILYDKIEKCSYEDVVNAVIIINKYKLYSIFNMKIECQS